MPKRRKHSVRYLETRRRADGVTAYYYCPPAKAVKAGVVQRAPLGTYLAAALEKAQRYNEILDAWRNGEECPRGAPAHGTIEWAVERFRSMWDYPIGIKDKSLSESTKQDYDSYLRRLVDIQLKNGGRLGDMPMKALKARHALRLYQIFGKADAQGKITARRSGIYALQVFHRLWNVIGKAELEIAVNPFSTLSRSSTKRRKVKWTYDEVMDLYDASVDEGLLSIGVAALLSYEFIQREVDVLHMTWRTLLDGVITQSKGDKDAYFNLSPELKAALDLLKRQSAIEFPRDLDKIIVLYEGTGRPYDARNFRKKAAEVRKAAGLSDGLKIGDLRRSGTSETTAAGATDSETRSMTGHSDTATLARHYDVEAADKARRGHRKRMAKRKTARAAREKRKAAEDRDAGAPREQPAPPAPPEEETPDAAA